MTAHLCYEDYAMKTTTSALSIYIYIYPSPAMLDVDGGEA